MCFRVAVVIGLLSLCVLGCGVGFYFAVRKRTQGFYVSGISIPICFILPCCCVNYLLSFLDINFYEAQVKEPVCSGMRILETADFITDIGTIGIIFNVLPVPFRVLGIISLILTLTSNLVGFVYLTFLATPGTFRAEQLRLTLGIILAGAEDLIMIPINIFFLLESNFEGIDVGNLEVFAILISALLGILVGISRFWSAVVHFLWANPVYLGDYQLIRDYLQMEDNNRI